MMSPIVLFAAASAIGVLLGLAALCDSKEEATLRKIIAITIYSGVTSLIVALLWYNVYGESQPYFLLGMAGVAGFGGARVLSILRDKIFSNGIRAGQKLSEADLDTPKDSDIVPSNKRDGSN